MNSLSIQGHKRDNLSKSANNQYRAEGWVPCELYGNAGNVHFLIFVTDLKDLVYTAEKYKVLLDIDGTEYNAIAKEMQFHPLSDELIHIDFHEIKDDQVIKIELPIEFTGTATGVREGGKLIKKLRRLKVKGMPKDMPDTIKVDVTKLGLGKSIKVKDVVLSDLEIMNSPSIPMATVEVPRSMKGKGATEDK